MSVMGLGAVTDVACGIVEIFDPRQIEGWVEVEQSQVPVRVSLYLNEAEVASSWADRPSEYNASRVVFGFRFVLRDLWAYCRPTDRLSVRIGGRALPIVGEGMYKRVDKGRSGTHTLEYLQHLFGKGYAFGKDGHLMLLQERASSKVEAVLNRGGDGVQSVSIRTGSENRLYLSRKKFDRITGETLQLAARSALHPRLKDVLTTVGDVVGAFKGSLTEYRDPLFLAAVDAARDELLSLAKGFDLDVGDYEAWMTAHDLLMLRMRIVDAQSCRKVAEEIFGRCARGFLLKSDNWRNITPLEYMTFSSWAVCQADEALVPWAQSMYDNLDPQVAKEVGPIWRGLLLSKGDTASYRNASEPINKSPSGKAYGRYLQGKSVAVVGPVNVGLPNGEEIESFDIVIRFNHHDDSVYDESQAGRRTDVSYYPNPAFKKLVVDKPSRLSGLRYAVPQNASGVATPEQIAAIEAEVRSQYRGSNAIIYKSHGNAAQRLLFDLCRFACGPIKFFNMNLWLSSYDKAYHDQPIVYPCVFIHHDPLSNFIFTQKVVAKGLVQADEKLKEVLAGSHMEYLKRLDSAYGEPLRQSQDDEVS